MRRDLWRGAPSVLVFALVLSMLSGCAQLEEALQDDQEDGGKRYWGDYVAEYEGGGILGAIALSADSYGNVDISVTDGADQYTGTGTVTDAGEFTGDASGPLGSLNLTGNLNSKAALPAGTIGVTGAFTVTGAQTRPVMRGVSRMAGTYNGSYSGVIVGVGNPLTITIDSQARVTLKAGGATASGQVWDGHFEDSSGEQMGLAGSGPLGGAVSWIGDVCLVMRVYGTSRRYGYVISGATSSDEPGVPSTIFSASGPFTFLTGTSAVIGVRG